MTMDAWLLPCVTSDCPYGDRADDYCADLKTRDCYTERVRQTCCATCRRRRLHLTGEYADVYVLVTSILHHLQFVGVLLGETGLVFQSFEGST